MSKLSVSIQAGGESKRMGTDKGLVLLSGKPLILHVIERVTSIADEMIIACNDISGYAQFYLPIFPDIFLGLGALSGLYTALASATHEYVAVVACDMIFVNAEMLKAQFQLLQDTGADCVVPVTSKGFEPFHAVYRRTVCRDAVKTALSDGKKRVDSWFGEVNFFAFSEELISRYDQDGKAFININTPGDLATLEFIFRDLE